MEEKRPGLSRRRASFNPEAATFSPTVPKAGAAVFTTEPTPPMSPLQSVDKPDTYEDDSPFRPAREMRPIYEANNEPSISQPGGPQSNQSHMPFVTLREFLQVLNQTRDKATEDVTSSMQSINTAMPYRRKYFWPTMPYDPGFSAPEVDELSTNLGLSGTLTGENTGDHKSPVRPVNPTDSKGHANISLHAHYLNNQTISDNAAIAPQNLHGYGFGAQKEWESKEDQPTMIVQPPPGFGGERPRKIHVEERGAAYSGILDPQLVPTGHAVLGHLRRFSDLQSVSPTQQHNNAHRPSARRHTRPRASTRAKRSDQGPEPSAADIYPDDAVYISSRRPSYAPEPIPPLHKYTPSIPNEQSIIVEDAMSWPTPAEVYAEKSNEVVAAQSNSFAQHSTTDTFDLFKDHHYPSAADIRATDDDIEALLSIIPHIFELDLPDPVFDERPLTRGQLDGTRYGVRFNGIGLGDSWKGVEVGGDPDMKARWCEM